jgi:hypothetical protein
LNINLFNAQPDGYDVLAGCQRINISRVNVDPHIKPYIHIPNLHFEPLGDPFQEIRQEGW